MTLAPFACRLLLPEGLRLYILYLRNAQLRAPSDRMSAAPAWWVLQ